MVVFDYSKVNRTYKKAIQKECDLLYSLKGEKMYTYRELVQREYALKERIPTPFFVDSGTTALQLALELCNIRKGSRVAIPLVNYSAAALTIVQQKAIPIPVDIKQDCTIDPGLIPECDAIMAVHLFGQACDMDAIKKHKVPIIEDACEAHGSTYKGQTLGSLGSAAALSFSHHKTLGAYGGGAVISPRFNELKSYLQIEYDSPNLLKTNRAPAKMSFIDMALLRVKIKNQEEIYASKEQASTTYDTLLKDIAQVEIIPPTKDRVIKQMYVCYVENREGLVKHLEKNKIQYNMPFKAMHELKLYNKFAREQPNAMNYAKKAIFLPMHTFVEHEEIERVVKTIKEFYQ